MEEAKIFPELLDDRSACHLHQRHRNTQGCWLKAEFGALTLGDDVSARDQVQGILLVPVLEVVQVVAFPALPPIICQSSLGANPCPGEPTFQGSGAGVLQGDVVAMVGPHDFEKSLHLQQTGCCRSNLADVSHQVGVKIDTMH